MSDYKITDADIAHWDSLDDWNKLAKNPEYQIAIRRAKEKRDKDHLALFRWMVEMRLTVQESAFFNYPHGNKWSCLDVDGEILGNGTTAVEAIQSARDFVENRTDEEYSDSVQRAMNRYQSERADVMRDRAKDGEL